MTRHGAPRGTIALALACMCCGCHGESGDIPNAALASAALPVTGPPALPDSAPADAPGQVYVDSLGKANAHLTGGQIAGAVTALNDAEIGAARLAAARGHTDAARQFAQLMIDDHTRANAQLAELARADTLSPAPSPLKEYVDHLGAQALSVLHAAPAAAFDSAYVGTQIGMHQAALSLLDSRLIPGAGRADLRGFLVSLRGGVDEHLQRAIVAAATLATPEDAR
jgi:putative membrane protein